MRACTVVVGVPTRFVYRKSTTLCISETDARARCVVFTLKISWCRKDLEKMLEGWKKYLTTIHLESYINLIYQTDLLRVTAVFKYLHMEQVPRAKAFYVLEKHVRSISGWELRTSQSNLTVLIIRKLCSQVWDWRCGLMAHDIKARVHDPMIPSNP